MKILVLHHWEAYWEVALKQIANKSFDDICQDLHMYLEELDFEFDKVILTQFEEHRATDEHDWNGITPLVDQWETYMYGWCKDSLEDWSEESLEDITSEVNGKEVYEWDAYGYTHTYIESGGHSEVVFVADWMKDLKGHEVYLAGAFDGECIEDVECAFDWLEIDYQRIEELIYGH